MKKVSVILLLFAIIFSMASAARAEAIHAVAGGSDQKKLQEVVESDPKKINLPDQAGLTPLHYAAYHGKDENVIYLISKGAKINAVEKLKNTPLHLAVFQNQVKVVKILLEKGADINLKNGKGWTPLHWAADLGNNEIVLLLLKKGANVNALDDLQETPLDKATRKGKTETVKLLREKGGTSKPTGMAPDIQNKSADKLAVRVRNKNENLDTRIAIIKQLGYLRDKKGVAALIQCLSDKEAKIRENAAVALGDIGDTSAVGPLKTTMRDKSAHVRIAVVTGLGKINDKRVISPLIAALNDGNAEVRIAAVSALSKWKKEDRAKEAIKKARWDKDSNVSKAAENALK